MHHHLEPGIPGGQRTFGRRRRSAAARRRTAASSSACPRCCGCLAPASAAPAPRSCPPSPCQLRERPRREEATTGPPRHAPRGEAAEIAGRHAGRQRLQVRAAAQHEIAGRPARGSAAGWRRVDQQIDGGALVGRDHGPRHRDVLGDAAARARREGEPRNGAGPGEVVQPRKARLPVGLPEILVAAQRRRLGSRRPSAAAQSRGRGRSGSWRRAEASRATVAAARPPRPAAPADAVAGARRPAAAAWRRAWLCRARPGARRQLHDMREGGAHGGLPEPEPARKVRRATARPGRRRWCCRTSHPVRPAARNGSRRDRPCRRPGVRSSRNEPGDAP